METPHSTPQFLRVAEAAKVVQLSTRFLYQAMRTRGGLRATRFGRAVRITRDDLLAWANSNQKPLFRRNSKAKGKR